MTKTIKEIIHEGTDKSFKKNEDEIQSYIYIKNQEERIEFSEENIENGFKQLEKLAKERKKNKKTLDDLIERTNSLMNELFDLIEATEEQKEEYLKYLFSEYDLIDDIHKDIFKIPIDKETEYFRGKPSEILLHLYENIPQEKQEQLQLFLEDENFKTDEKAEQFFEEMNKYLPEEEVEYSIKPVTIDFSGIELDDIMKILDKQKAITEETIRGMKNSFKIQSEYLKMNKQFSIFISKDNEIVKDETISEKGQLLFVRICEDMLQSMEDYQSFTILTKRRGISKLFAEDFLEEKEIELEDIEKLKEKIVATQKDREEEVFDYVPISSEQKKKIVTQEKIVPQLFLLGDKIKEKISFDITGDSGDKFILHCIMEQYPIEFTTETFQTLESMMTIQNYFEKNFPTIRRRPFSTKDIIYLNKGGKISKYTPKDIEETNQEILALMSAIGRLDITDFMLQYYGLSEETIVNENEAIFDSIQTEKEYNKKLDEIRKRKMEELPEENKFPLDKIKKISELKNFVNLSGIDIQYQDEKVPNDTMWYFRDERPIPLFDFIKMTGRYTMLPLVMDSYLQDTPLNNEITRVLKNAIGNLNYYKTKKRKQNTDFIKYYFEGIESGQTKTKKYQPSEAMILLKQKKIVGKWKYKIVRTIDSLAKDCKFDNERTIGTEKKWKNTKERPRFVDSIVTFLRKAKEGGTISDFELYTDKEKKIKNEDYITENEIRHENTKNKTKGKDTIKKGKKNPSIYKVSIIIE